MPAHPSSSPGFVSFSNYLDANQGQLDAERQGQLAGVDQAGQKVQGDLTTVGQQVYDQANKNASGDYTQGTTTSTTNPHQYETDTTTTTAYTKNPTADDPTKFDYTSMPGYGQLSTDLNSAGQTYQTALAGGAGAGKGDLRDASLVNADPNYQKQVSALGDKYKSTFSDYLNNLSGQAQAGAAAYAPPAPVSTTSVNLEKHWVGDTGMPSAPNEGPVMKPHGRNIYGGDDNGSGGYTSPMGPNGPRGNKDQLP